MANNEITIEPMIFHGPGGCPLCSGPLVVVDSELTMMELNSDGIPTSEETLIRCEAACLHCNNRVNMIRWKGGYIPYSDSSLIIKKEQLKYELEQRVKECNSSSNKENPFALNV